jgi:hypothetical protein
MRQGLGLIALELTWVVVVPFKVPALKELKVYMA